MSRVSFQTYSKKSALKLPGLGIAKKTSICLGGFNPLDSYKRVNSLQPFKRKKTTKIRLAKLFNIKHERKMISSRSELNTNYCTTHYNKANTNSFNYIAINKPATNSSSSLNRIANENSLDKDCTMYPTTKESFGTLKSGMLDKTMVMCEKQKTDAKIAKEIRILIKKAEQNANLSLFTQIRNPELVGKGFASRDQDYNVKSFDAIRHMKRSERSYMNYKKIRRDVTKEIKLINNFHMMQNKEMKELIKNMNECKREQLIEGINNYEVRTENFKKKKDEIARLKQQMRKYANIKKDAIKNALEKSFKRFKVKSLYI